MSILSQIIAYSPNKIDTETKARSLVQGPRNSFSGGGLARALMLLKNLNKTGPVKGLEEKLIRKFRSEGMNLLEAIKKAQVESTTIKNKAKNKILDDAMKETDITSDDYVELIDEKIKIIEPEYYRDIKKWSNNRPDLADKTRALFYPDWAEAKYGENYMGVLQNRQAKAIQENIDPNVKEPLSPSDQMVSDIDDMNTANIDEFFGRKKNAEGGFQQLVQPNADGLRPGYGGKYKKIDQYNRYNTETKKWEKLVQDKKASKETGKIIRNWEIQKKGETKREFNKRIITEGKNRALKSSALQSKQTIKARKYIDNWTKNWLDKNIKKYDLRDFEKMTKSMSKEWASHLKKIDLPKGFLPDLSFSTGLPRVTTSMAETVKPFVYEGISFYTPFQEKTVDPNNTFRKMFLKNKVRTTPGLKNKLKGYFDWIAIDKSKGQYHYMKPGGQTLTSYKKLMDKDLVYLLSPDSKLRGSTTYEFFNSFDKDFSNSYNNYQNKIKTGSEVWRKSANLIEKELGWKKDSILKSMEKERNALKKIFDVSRLPEGMGYSIEHGQGITAAAQSGDKKLMELATKDLIGTTQELNRAAGFGGFEHNRNALLRDIRAGINVKDNITSLNKLSRSAYKDFGFKGNMYSMKDGQLTSKPISTALTQEERFGQYFKQIAKTKEGSAAIKEQYGNLNNLLKQLCPRGGSASGGRIGFNTAGAVTGTVACGAKALDDGLTTGKWESPEKAKIAKEVLKKAGKGGIGARILSELFGPVAIASLPVFEAGIAGYDTITSGTPFNEAINKTLLHYALGDKTKADPEKLKQADILKMSDGPEKEMLIGLYSDIGNLNRVMNNHRQKAGLEQNKELYEAVDIMGYGDEGASATQAQKQIEAINNKISQDRAQGKDYMTLSRAVDDPYAKGLAESKEGELLAKRDANSLSSRLFGTENPYYSSSNYRGNVDPDKIAAMEAKGPDYTQLNKWSPGASQDKGLYSRDQIISFLKTVPDMEVTDETVDFLHTKLNADYFRNVLNQPGMLGTQYSEGGIASLNVKK